MPAMMMTKKKSYLAVAVLAVLVAVLVAACSGRFFVGPLHPSFPSSSSCHCLDKLSGVVEDCCCDYATVNSLNREALHPILQSLVRTPFFRYFKAKLWCDCPFWPDDGMCRLRDCSVCECPDGEFPETLKAGGRRLSLDDLICQEGKPEALVDRTLDLKAFHGWAVSRDNPWTLDDEREEGDVTYLNLLLNPERYTGYTGPSARRIWEAIYHDNVLAPHDKFAPPESRVLYKLISVTKASEYFVQAEYNTENPSEDDHTTSLIQKLVQNERLQAACPKPFDEAKLWQGKDGFGGSFKFWVWGLP
ncbi:hypothetical protein GOP47_0001650 [Adiantum capillus-veneris]|uniref:Uncharacterized protein n=1 Tax=Adiantum capillus-veneris TaxID=13818 RepID=A0A9D4ZQB3_ADICA|nr:hypothetical protein GOP47_0001650 [Adiantum capillus-veneris]